MHKIKEWKLFMVLFVILMILTAANIPYASAQTRIALVTTAWDVSNSVVRALNEMGRQFDTFDTDDFSAVNFSQYNAVIVAMDGGSVEEPSIVNIANYANAGGNLIMLGGTATSNFANAVNTYLLDIDETNYEWFRVAGTPHLIVTNRNHYLSNELPYTYNLVNLDATYYMIRSQDAAAQVVAQNGDGFAALIQKPLGSGHLKWFINSPASSYWADANDYNILKTIIRNAFTLEVGPSGYPFTSIQAAINAAVPGDIVLVHDGTYVENVNFSGKAITVKSVNGAARTIIDANGSGRGVTFSSGEGSGSILDGFTVTNGNVVPGAGGGIQCWNSSPTIANCIIIGNYASYNGGGISCYGEASPTISNCTISGNTSGDGWGGGISCGYFSHPTITNCTISGNNGYLGAAISCDTSCSPTITNCTITGNVGTVTGGIYIYASSSPSVKNTILWGNTPNQIYFVDPGVSSITLTYSNVDQDGYAGSNGNIRQNPLFVDAANENFYLQPNSPCIDAATSEGAPSTDMEGFPRYDNPLVPNTGGGTYPYYDIGAYEKEAVTLFSPNEPEVIPPGSVYPIRWGSRVAVKFKLWYSMDNGLTWIPIPKTGDFLQDTFYDWQVPKPTGNKKKCLVKVKGFDDKGKRVGVDKSDATFTIEVVKVTSPNGGEYLTSGSNPQITWNTNATKGTVRKVTLSYTLNNGITWKPIATLSGNPGVYNDWTVPTRSSLNCKVKVVLKNSSGTVIGSDVSDSVFAIGP